jgi:hypothetical protein
MIFPFVLLKTYLAMFIVLYSLFFKLVISLKYEAVFYILSLLRSNSVIYCSCGPTVSFINPCVFFVLFSCSCSLDTFENYFRVSVSFSGIGIKEEWVVMWSLPSHPFTHGKFTWPCCFLLCNGFIFQHCCTGGIDAFYILSLVNIYYEFLV